MLRRDLLESLLSSLLDTSFPDGVTATSSSSLFPSTPAPSTPTAAPTTSRPDVAPSNTADVSSTPSLTLPQSSTSPRSVLTEISLSLTTVTETSFSPAPTPAATRTSNDPITSSSSISSMSLASPLPILSPSPSAGQAHSGTGADVGIAIGVSAVAICLVLASFLYLKRRRSRAVIAGADSFVAGSPSHCSFGGASPLHADAVGNPSVTEIHGGVTARADSWLVAHISPVDSSMLDHVVHVSHRGREGVDRPVSSEKLFWEPRHRQGPVSTSSNEAREPTGTVAEVSPASDLDFHGHPAIVYRHGPRRETDGGVRLGGGRPGEDSAACDYDQESTVSDASTLPPSYSSDFGEAW